MDVFALTRALVDIESISGNEAAVGNFLFDHLTALGAQVERMPVEQNRFNIFAQWGPEPTVTFSTHMDTVPPFIGFFEEPEYLYGRGVCDAKGILASMIKAIETLAAADHPGLGLLVVVGEERGSLGAIIAGREPRGSKFLINGEPTENKLAVGTKGAHRFEITAKGKMAHSAYPELGESAILKLLDALEHIRNLPLSTNEILGPSTLNIGLIGGGRAPNVIPDQARAELLFRLVDDPARLREAVPEACCGLADVREMLCIPAQFLGSVPGFETCVVNYTTDIPLLIPAWGEPYLLGPGTIHVAHTDHERIAKKDLVEAVDLYCKLAKTLWSRA